MGCDRASEVRREGSWGVRQFQVCGEQRGILGVGSFRRVERKVFGGWFRQFQVCGEQERILGVGSFTCANVRRTEKSSGVDHFRRDCFKRVECKGLWGVGSDSLRFTFYKRRTETVGWEE